MKAESFSPHIAVPAVEAKPFELTYGEFLELVRERRLAELEESHPGETKRNNNLAGNLVRGLRAFMKANDLREADAVGAEMRDETSWEAARDLMGPNATSNKSLAGKARSWALEVFRAAEVQHNDETFGQRLSRLRRAAGLSQTALAKSVSRAHVKVRRDGLNRWERGRGYPSADSRAVVESIEAVLRVPPGTLTEKMPKAPYHATTSELEIPASVKRRLSPHLPHDFDARSDDEQEQILSWIAENILSTPKEVFEDGTISSASTQDIWIFALARDPGTRCKLAPAHLLDELDKLGKYKTAPLPPDDMKRNKDAVWGKEAHAKNDYELRAFFGALDRMGLPSSAQSLSILLSPKAVNRFIEWRYQRRGAYTGTLKTFLQSAISFLQPENGFLTQIKGFGAPLEEIPGFIDKDTVDLAAADWEAACAKAKDKLRDRYTQIEAVLEKGRDPFEALYPVVEDPYPLFVYWRIVDEIRSRMPGPEYPVRTAEALRSLAIMRIALGSALRSKNLRELLICPKGGRPRSEKELRRLERGELRWKDGEWWIAIPRVAFKNASSAAVEDWNEFPLSDADGKLDADISAYLNSREVLLAGHPDPGTFFVKSMRSNAKLTAYDRNSFYEAFRAIITTYGIYNPYTGRGAIEGLKPHGPHPVRHVLGTHLIKNNTVSEAAAALFDTEEMIRAHYGRYAPADRHRDAMQKAWIGFPAQQTGGKA
jgi:transcriptional regulator with XRE-family HTH domain